jgi:asparaginyl-tRNA synthetase
MSNAATATGNPEGYPISTPASWSQPSGHLEHLLQHRWYYHLYHLLDAGAWGAHLFLRKRGATQALVPLTTSAVSSPMGKGSDSLPVQATIGGRDIYLADSMQFMLELTVRINSAPSYYVAPSFRGEPGDYRHLNQFFHVELELPGGQAEAEAWAEGLIRFLARHLLETAKTHLLAMGADLSRIAALGGTEGSFPRIEFDDAVALLSDDPRATSIGADAQLTISEHGERELCRRLGDFTWLCALPRAVVPFYQAVRSSNTRTTATADLLAGIGETLGLGERAYSGAEVLRNLAFCGVDPAAYSWYVDMKRAYPRRTAGFGLGLERFLMWCVGGQDIRDFCLLLRDSSGRGEP